ncbi:hypothetical protein, partial [Burkholderia multivorans]|uniref:hypothetical protein n=1 Tax=Burkholderia multivorans TaxID=87883 RepID=UPI001C61420B
CGSADKGYGCITPGLWKAKNRGKLIVPDQVINWVGGHAAPTPGREDNDRLRSALGVFTNKMEQYFPGRSSGGKNTGGGTSKPSNQDGVRG